MSLAEVVLVSFRLEKAGFFAVQTLETLQIILRDQACLSFYIARVKSGNLLPFGKVGVPDVSRHMPHFRSAQLGEISSSRWNFAKGRLSNQGSRTLETSAMSVGLGQELVSVKTVDGTALPVIQGLVKQAPSDALPS